jgi:hypothetical protein
MSDSDKKATFWEKLFSASNEKPAEEQPSFLTLTPHTIRFGHGSEVFQLRNLSRIGKYRVVETKVPLGAIAVSVVAGFALLLIGGAIPSLLGLGFLAGSGYGIWTWIQPRAYAFGLETDSGTTRYLKVRDEGFIDDIVNKVTEYMETKQTDGWVINIEDRSIHNTGEIGSIATGDHYAKL